VSDSGSRLGAKTAGGRAQRAPRADSKASRTGTAERGESAALASSDASHIACRAVTSPARIAGLMWA
jgi:hypothetical protein